jgi:hypothetical protein
LLTFDLHMLHSNAGHMLGRFRLAVTDSSRALYGQGPECTDPSPGGVASWTVLQPISAVSANGQTLTIQPDGSILASGVLPASDVVTVVAQTSVPGITGFRLEAMADASLPHSGPGRFASNGNFVLTEIELDAEAIMDEVPTLGVWARLTLVLLIVGAGGLLIRRQS